MLRGGESSKLGMSDAQAEDAWYLFGSLMSERSGAPGAETLDYGHILHSEATNRAREASQRVAGEERPAAHPRRDREGGPRYRFAQGSNGVPFASPATPQPRARVDRATRPVATGAPLPDSLVEICDSARDDIRKNVNRYALAPTPILPVSMANPSRFPNPRGKQGRAPTRLAAGGPESAMAGQAGRLLRGRERHSRQRLRSAHRRDRRIPR
jgi:hypothetical protein